MDYKVIWGCKIGTIQGNKIEKMFNYVQRVGRVESH